MKKILSAVLMGLWTSGCGLAGEPSGTATNAGTKPSAGPDKAAAAKEEGAVKEHKSGEWTPGLTEAEKKTLFQIVDDTLAWCVKGGRGKFSFDAYTLTPKLKEMTATFVTLKEGGDLRGCIGSLAPVAPMAESVHENAVHAAMHDTRFSPVTPEELPKLEVHISLLSPIRDIASLDEFKVGEHGIILEKGMYRAVYLPEVAVEQKWTKETTLSELSRKAGLSRDAWKQGARFKVFSSVVLMK